MIGDTLRSELLSAGLAVIECGDATVIASASFFAGIRGWDRDGHYNRGESFASAQPPPGFIPSPIDEEEGRSIEEPVHISEVLNALPIVKAARLLENI